MREVPFQNSTAAIRAVIPSHGPNPGSSRLIGEPQRRLTTKQETSLHCILPRNIRYGFGELFDAQRGSDPVNSARRTGVKGTKCMQTLQTLQTSWDQHSGLFVLSFISFPVSQNVIITSVNQRSCSLYLHPLKFLTSSQEGHGLWLLHLRLHSPSIGS